ncbi:hypothetical protein AB4Z09_09610 [Rhodococcus sp. TAF43]|nr:MULTISPECIES: hypothetical protein [unclassified Rhodococcus (in: high G+C Gram-positive bacteria)]QKT12116.1 hypothetical protein HUN07_16655 [Rhodococcus sp. W8901]
MSADSLAGAARLESMPGMGVPFLVVNALLTCRRYVDNCLQASAVCHA